MVGEHRGNETRHSVCLAFPVPPCRSTWSNPHLSSRPVRYNLESHVTVTAHIDPSPLPSVHPPRSVLPYEGWGSPLTFSSLLWRWNLNFFKLSNKTGKWRARFWVFFHTSSALASCAKLGNNKGLPRKTLTKRIKFKNKLIKWFTRKSIATFGLAVSFKFP